MFLNHWYLSGAAVLMLNSLRNSLRGYRRPRPFGARDQDRAYEYDIEVVDRWAQFTDFSGLNVLELGPGPDLGTGAEIVRRGAASYLAVDAFPLARDVDAAFYDRFGGIGTGSLDYVVCSFDAIEQKVGRTFDLVVSNACLEHVPDVRKLFNALHAVLRPGARMIHLIDAQTHSRPLRAADPLNIYRFSDRVYSLIARYPGAPNRLLADDYERLAVEHGFTQVEIVRRRSLTARYTRRIASYLPRRFADADSLGAMSFYLLARSATAAVVRR